MSSRIISAALGALTLSAACTAAPAEARTVVRIGVGIGAPIYARPYRWARYPGYYPPPYYYGAPPIAIYPYAVRPYWRRPYYARPYRHRWWR